MENIIKENTIQESVDPTSKIESVGFEVSKSDIQKLTTEMNTLGSFIDHDKTMTADSLGKLNKSIEGIKIDVGGVMLGIKEAEDVADLKQNAKIWKEIKNGNIENVDKMTILLDEIAEILVKCDKNLNFRHLGSLTLSAARILAKHNKSLIFHSLTTLPDDLAECLGKHHGGELNLSELSLLSGTAAKFLSEHRGSLYLPSLSSISDTVAMYLARTDDWLNLDGVQNLSVKAAEYLGGFQGESLDLRGLSNLPPAVAKKLANFGGKIEFGEFSNDKFNKLIDKYRINKFAKDVEEGRIKFKE
jgi:hypothetical protein